jgi:hypothetical protein
MHRAPFAQPASLVHDDGQVAITPSQAKFPQEAEACPAARVRQVPSEPMRSQRAQPPGHGVPQHTPLEQFVEAHMPARVHEPPRPSAGRHAPLLQ